MQVVALIHEENGNFGASFPDFPGCTTVADNADTIIAKAAEVLAFHVEGMAEDGLDLPQVRTLTQLRADPEFREESADAMIALVPYAPPARAARINVTVDESLLARIDRAAAAAGETRSGYLSDAAKRRLAMEASVASRELLPVQSRQKAQLERQSGSVSAHKKSPRKVVVKRDPDTGGLQRVRRSSRTIKAKRRKDS